MKGATRLLGGLGSRDFRLLWVSTLGSAGGMSVQQVATGWMVLEMTDSALAVGAVGAARLAPFLVLGMLAGALADRFDRRRMLLVISGASVVYALAIALLAAGGVAELWHVVALTLAFGVARAFEPPARQALVYDLVGSEQALRGIAVNAMALPIMGILGGVLGGALIPVAGVQGSFLLMAACYGASMFFLLPMGYRQGSGDGKPRASFWSTMSSGLRLLRRNEVVLTLVLLSVAAEVFAFSHATLVPVFARDVLHAGPVGLGLLMAARAAGTLVATIALAALTAYRDKLGLLLGAFGLFGLFLVLFSLSRSFGLSLVLMVGVGGAATAFDLLQQTIMQLSVPEEERGRAMGYWVASLGFGPVGHLEVGALAGLLGAPLSMGLHGVVILGAWVAASVVLRGRGRGEGHKR